MNVEEDPFRTVHEAVSLFQGHGIDHLNLSISDTFDALEVTLLPFEPDRSIGLSVRKVHYFAVNRWPGDDISLVDFRLQTLSPSRPWPPQLPGQFIPAATAPPLLWLHGDGAMTLDVVAGIVTVLKQAG